MIKSDNGSPFAATQALLGLTKLAVAWVALGIELEPRLGFSAAVPSI